VKGVAPWADLLGPDRLAKVCGRLPDVLGDGGGFVRSFDVLAPQPPDVPDAVAAQRTGVDVG